MGDLTATTATAAANASTVTVNINGVNYTSAVIAGTNGQLGTASAAPAIPATVTTQGITTATESSVVTFSALTVGQSVTVNGKTLVAGTGGVSAADAAIFFGSAGTLPLNASSIGTNAAAFTPAAAAGSTVTFTSYGKHECHRYHGFNRCSDGLHGSDGSNSGYDQWFSGCD